MSLKFDEQLFDGDRNQFLIDRYGIFVFLKSERPMIVKNFVKSSVMLLFLFHSAQTREEQHAKEKAAKLGFEQKSTTETVMQLATEEQKLPDLSRYLKITSISAVNFGKSYSKEEQAKFEQEAVSEFKLNNFYLSLENGKFIKMNRQTKVFSTYDIKRTLSGFSLDCKTCNMPAFTLVEQSTDRIVCNQPSQDEGQAFEFRFTFER